MKFQSISPKDIQKNPFTLIGTTQMLVTSGNLTDGYNTMTASWGGVGVLWNKSVIFVFIRPQRYTNEFLNKNDELTLSFFCDGYKKVLAYCGSHSGRDVNKAAECGITPFSVGNTVAFSEAELIIHAKKLSVTQMKPEDFISPEIVKNYSAGDYHFVYTAEILDVLTK